MDKSECLPVVSSIGVVRHTRRHVWQKLWCVQVGLLVSGRLDDFSDRLGTTGIRCAFRYDGDDVMTVLKVTNAN